MAELLSCPFCGGEAEFVEGADDDGQWVAIGCPDCGAGSRQHYAVMEDPRPHAQSAWNTRASTQPAPAFPREAQDAFFRWLDRPEKHDSDTDPQVPFKAGWDACAALLQGKQP